MERDPFGLAELTRAVLDGWSASPTRLSEDAAAEAELIEIGYRDRLFTELVANAADAAVAAGEAGHVRIRAVGHRLQIANTGAPLTTEGVRSLTALRVSPKSAEEPSPGTVGRFGLGFRATAFAPHVVVASTSGSVEFDVERTRAAVAELGLDADSVPGQRLAWPSDASPAAGFATEIDIDVADDATARNLLAMAAGQAGDLLLELQAIARIDVGDTTFTRSVDETGRRVDILRDGAVDRRWLVAAAGGTRWLVPVDGDSVRPQASDVLRSPTATDIELTLPARVITDLPLTPDRRDLHPSADVSAAAQGYADLMAAVPDDQKGLLIPAPALGAGRVDARLREAVRDQLADADWVPSVSGATLRPSRTWVLPGITGSAAALLGELFEPLASPDVSDRVSASLLVGLGARQLGLADVAELLAGVAEREPAWWARIYAELGALAPDARTVEELSTLPVPRADGRMHVGARGLFVIDGLDTLDDPPPVSWVPTIHPAAYDPLLDRIGLARLSPAEALEHPALLVAADDPSGDGDGEGGLVDAVLRLLALPDAVRAPAALGALEVRGADGDYWPVDETLLPGSPLAAVLTGDAPFGVVDATVVQTYGETALRLLGAGWGFSVVHDAAPVAPDHDLPDEDLWWDSQEVPPDELVAVRDLDLVDPDKWRAALQLLVDDPETTALLESGYTRWWLRRYAEIDGTPLRLLRAHDDSTLSGLFDAANVPEPAHSLLAGPAPEDADEASAWLAALGDPGRSVPPGVAVRAHSALLSARVTGAFVTDEVEAPDGVRALDGSVTDRPVVIDGPWWIAVVARGHAVLPGLPVDAEDARLLADLLDAELASEVCRALPESDGDPVDVDAGGTCAADAVARLATLGLTATGEIRLHDDLHVLVESDGRTDLERARVRVPWWVDASGRTHLSR